MFKYPEITENAVNTILFSVMRTIKTGIDAIRSITMFLDHDAVICGEEDGLTKIKSYNLFTGAEMISISLEEAFGLAEVKIGGKRALAVSLRSVEYATYVSIYK